MIGHSSVLKSISASMILLETSNSHSKLFQSLNKYFESRGNVVSLNMNGRCGSYLRKGKSFVSISPFRVSMCTMPDLYLGLGKRQVLWVHDTLYFDEEMVYGDNQGRFQSEIENLFEITERADWLVAPSVYSKERISSKLGIAKDKIIVQNCIIDPELLKIKFVVEAVLLRIRQRSERFILFVGSAHFRKNLVSAYEAFLAVKDTIDDVFFVVVSSPRADIKSTISIYEKLSMDDNVLLLNNLSDGHLNWLMSNASLFLCPTLEEGFGLPNIESQLQGCPVVSSNVSCIPEIVGDSGILVDPLDIEQIFNACILLLSSEHVRRDYVEKGYTNSSKYCDMSLYDNLYNIVLEMNRDRSD